MKVGLQWDAPRTHGYSLKGQRCHGIHDWHARGRVNAIGAILDFELLAVDLWQCNIDSNIFYAWLTKALLPKCPAGAVIVLDNATFHKRADIQAVIQEAGHILEYLPLISILLSTNGLKLKLYEDVCDVIHILYFNYIYDFKNLFSYSL